MPFSHTMYLDILEALEDFLDRKRPPLHIRNQLDLEYKTEDQSVIIYEIRPAWDNPKVILEHPFAKTTYVKEHKHWKVFWQRADGKWHPYDAKPTVKTIKQFAKLVEEDEYGCFFG